MINAGLQPCGKEVEMRTIASLALALIVTLFGVYDDGSSMREGNDSESGYSAVVVES
jgi:hypothetical protein